MESNHERAAVVGWAKTTVKAKETQTEPTEGNPSGRWLDQTVRSETSAGTKTEKRVVEPIDPH